MSDESIASRLNADFNKKTSFNGRYKDLKEKGLAGFETPRANFTVRQSPGKGVIAHILVNYRDLGAEKDVSQSLAYGLTVTFPQSMESTYDRVAKKNVHRFGRTKEAELNGVVEMLGMGGGTVLHWDKDILEIPAVAAKLQSIPGYTGALEKLLDDRRSYMASEEDIAPKDESLENFSKMNANVLRDLRSQVNGVPDNATMNEEWAKYLERQEQKKGQNFSI